MQSTDELPNLSSCAKIKTCFGNFDSLQDCKRYFTDTIKVRLRSVNVKGPVVEVDIFYQMATLELKERLCITESPDEVIIKIGMPE